MPEAGEDARTREMVGQAVRSIQTEIQSGGRPGAGHAIDARMDSIASQAAMAGGGDMTDSNVRSQVSEIRDNLDRNHRRELQLTAMSRAARQVLDSESGSAIGTGRNGGSREQATTGPSRAPAAAAHRHEGAGRHVAAPTVQRAVTPARAASRNERASSQRTSGRSAARVTVAQSRPMRALEHGGHPDVPMAPPRPARAATHNQPGWVHQTVSR